jgi:hypothetical protein
MLFSSFWGSLKASFVTTETPRRGSRWCSEMGKDKKKKKKKKKKRERIFNFFRKTGENQGEKCKGSKEKEMRGGWKLYLLPWKALLEGGKGLKTRWKGKLKFSITFLSKQENKMLVMSKINLSQFHSDSCLSRNPKFPLHKPCPHISARVLFCYGN